MGSSRLPGKGLKTLSGRSVLAHCLDRCAATPNIDTVCCAVPEGPQNDPIAHEAQRLGYPVFRGSENDVLDRYHRAAKWLQSDVVVRVTSDCPLIDPVIVGATLALFLENECDFATNNAPASWPHGLDCEVFSASFLAEAAEKATSDFDREHVSPWMRNRPRVRLLNYAAPISDLSKHRWTLDTLDDFMFFERLFERMPPDNKTFDYRIPLSVVEEHPGIAAINRPDHLSVIETAASQAKSQAN
jgi:spore coat polysaccharide biosynthesis protein SpsF